MNNHLAAISAILKSGIRQYKFRNSKIQSIDYKPEGTKGAIFGFRTKEKMQDSRGIVLTSEEAIAENDGHLTHWTPNVYQYGTYADDQRLIVKGHTEDNLKQINTFVIDFDKVPGEELDEQCILDVAIELDLIPTILLETPGGYQAYFVLQAPWFISSKKNYQSVQIAKLVSKNLRKAFAEKLASVDKNCNHFGIARIPKADNVVYYYPALTYDMQQLISWSMKYQPSKTTGHVTLKLVPSGSQAKEKWVDILLSNPQIIGEKGKFGRNNAMFTLALAYFSSGMDQERCINDLDVFNSNLNYPLKVREVNRIINSAYSGRYQGASKGYVLELLANWGLELPSDTQLFSQNRGSWYKFKKDRSERKHSHLAEWKEDILTYLETQCFRYRPELQLTKSDIQVAVCYQDKEIPKRSLDKALKELQVEGKIYMKVKPGRGGGLILATRKALIRTVIVTNQTVKSAYKTAIRTFFEEAASLTKLFENEPRVEEIRLFEVPKIRAGTG